MIERLLIYAIFIADSIRQELLRGEVGSQRIDQEIVQAMLPMCTNLYELLFFQALFDAGDSRGREAEFMGDGIDGLSCEKGGGNGCADFVG